MPINQTHTLKKTWNHLSLASQFTLAGSIVLLMGMIVMGIWVTDRIEEGVTRNTAASTALYMESFVAPLVEELATKDELSLEKRAALDELLKDNELAQRIISFKIWKEGGLIAYSSQSSIIGNRFPTTPNLRAAWAGEVTAEFDSLLDEEDAHERIRNIPLLETYSPIRQKHTGRIYAVVEFYEGASTLKHNLFIVNLQSWLVVALVTLAMLGALAGIVFRGSRTIKQQRITLEQRVNELSGLLAQNKQLSERLQRSSQRTTEINESYLRRISADLHDGPAQQLSLGLLRLDSLEPIFEQIAVSKQEDSEIQVVRGALTEAITEIRHICAGLTLPVLDNISLDRLLKNVANTHMRRTATEVELDNKSEPDKLEKSIKICIYRFVQETLSNAFRHAGGSGQKIECQYEDGVLAVTVSDTGPGFQQSQTIGKNDPRSISGLGLSGLRERIESLGGQLEINSNPGQGSQIKMTFILEDNENKDG